MDQDFTESSRIEMKPKELVLVVDVNSELNQTMWSGLSRDFDFAHASGRREGRQKARTLNPSLVVLDSKLPSENGKAFYEDFRSQKGLSKIPVVVLVANMDENTRLKFLKAGVDDYLLVPFHAEQAQTRLKSLIQLRHEKEADLASENMYEELVERSPCAVLTADETGLIVTANHQLLNWFGYEREELIDNSIEILVPVRWRSIDQKIRTDFLERLREPFSSEEMSLLGRRKDGSEFPIEVSLGSIGAANRMRVTAIIRNASSRKNAEASVRELSERLSLALSAAKVGTWTVNLTDYSINWDSHHEALFGLAPGQFGGTIEQIASLIHPDDRERELKKLEAALKTHQPYRTEYRALWPDGSVHFIAGRGETFFDKKGYPERMTGVMWDITELKEAEAEVRDLNRSLEKKILERTAELSQEISVRKESEDRLQKAILDAPFPMMLFAENGEILLLSQIWTELTGYSKSEISTLQKWTELAYGEGSRAVLHYLQSLFSINEKRKEGEFTIRTKSGAQRIWDFTAVPMGLLTDGRRLLLSSATDITERKAAEAASKKMQEQMSLALDAAKMATWDWDIPADKIYRSDSFLALFGIEDRKISTSFQSLLALIHPDDVTSFKKSIESALAAGHDFRTAYRVAHPDGSIHWMESNGKVTRDDHQKAIRVSGVVRDVTDRRQAELSREAAEEKFRSVFNQAAVGISVLALDGSFLMVNRKLTKVVGYSEEELKKMKSQDITHPDDLDMILQMLSQVTAGKISNFSIEKRYRNKNQHDIWANLTASVVKTASGEPEYLIAIIEDIDQRKRIEQERDQLLEKIRESKEELEVRVFERTRELARSNADLEQFANVTSHDLREPLRMIVNYAQLLERRYSSQLDESANKYIAYMVEGARRMESLISDLLTYSRVGKGEIVRQATDLNEILNQVRRNLSSAIEESGAIITAQTLPVILASPLLIEQLLQNLLSNAIKFHQKGRRPEIRIHCKRREGEYLFSVSDNGIGIESHPLANR